MLAEYRERYSGKLVGIVRKKRKREGGASVMIDARVDEAELELHFHCRERDATELTGERGGNVNRSKGFVETKGSLKSIQK